MNFRMFFYVFIQYPFFCYFVCLLAPLSIFAMDQFIVTQFICDLWNSTMQLILLLREVVEFAITNVLILFLGW